MRVIPTSARREIDAIVRVDHARDATVVRRAGRIVQDVRARGDRAVRDWNRRLDADAPLEVTDDEIVRGWDATPRDVRQAIRMSIRHLTRVSRRQVPRPWSIQPRPGIRIDQRVVPLERVGCYVPGGRYPLPSTLIMTVVPARVAGVSEIVVVCPRPTPVVLCAALEAGVTRLFRAGGAQAIAALAYGTRTIPRVDKIVGPGNAYVAAAKRLVASDCSVDAHAGPSEIVVLADAGDAEVVAADLVAQAEHDPHARALLVTTRRDFALRVASACARRAADLPAARQALARNGAAIVARSRDEALALVDRLAPEHLVCSRAVDARRISAAGTIFIGRWSAQAAGDYCTGSNHVLPTGGAARTRGALGAADFVRVVSVQRLTRAGLGAIAPAVVALAEAEGLAGHAASIRVRMPVPLRRRSR